LQDRLTAGEVSYAASDIFFAAPSFEVLGGGGAMELETGLGLVRSLLVARDRRVAYATGRPDPQGLGLADPDG
jgi:hypothetical protein